MHLQINLDGNESSHALGALVVMLDALRGQKSVIHPDDNPAHGVEIAGGMRPWIDTTTVHSPAQTSVQGVPAAPTVAPPNPAAIFGGAPPAVPPAPPAVPQPPAVIPTAANMQPPAPPPGPAVLDSRGLPWDVRIHSSTKARNADGTWRTKRNVDAALVPVVEAELQRLMAIAAPVAAPQPPATPPMPPAAPVAPPMPPAAPVPPVPAPPPAPAGQPNTFAELMTFLTPLMAQQRVTMETITGCLTECGIAALPLLGARQDLVPVVWTKILGRLQA